MIILGLGNPGERYAHHRHNVGHMFVESWVQMHGSPPWRQDSSGTIRYAKISPEGHDIILATTCTFMNLSGRAATTALRYFDAETSDLCVVHDDLDLVLGKWKYGLARGPRMHNGIRSIETDIGEDTFYRLRIGIDHRDPDDRMPGEAYVLQNFTHEELEIVAESFPHMCTRILADLSRT